MKTISFYRYSYQFHRDEQNRPVVDALIEGKFVQRMFVTPEDGNELFLNLRKYQTEIERCHIRSSKWVDRGADNLYCKMFIKLDELNSVSLGF